jgi:hypothetical protein
MIFNSNISIWFKLELSFLSNLLFLLIIIPLSLLLSHVLTIKKAMPRREAYSTRAFQMSTDFIWAHLLLSLKLSNYSVETMQT